MIEKRVSDGSVLRLIWKWIKVGAIEDGGLLVSETGTAQGQPISPLLANIYLHYVLDEWFEEVVKPRLKGEAYEVRFADDAILCFQHKEDAEKVLRVLPKGFEKYGLTLDPEKTRRMEFGRYAVGNAKKQGKKPETFAFLGFPHMCARSRKGKFTAHVKTLAKHPTHNPPKVELHDHPFQWEIILASILIPPGTALRRAQSHGCGAGNPDWKAIPDSRS
jgi:RNA-directed DNA polymerase